MLLEPAIGDVVVVVVVIGVEKEEEVGEVVGGVEFGEVDIGVQDKLPTREERDDSSPPRGRSGGRSW